LDFNDNGGSSDTITRDDGGSFVTDGWESGDTGIIRGSAGNDDIEFTVTTAAAATLTLPTGTLAQTDLNQTGAVIYSMVTFQDIIDKDNTDATYLGVCTLSQNGLVEVNYNLIIGDEAGAGDIWFASRGDKVVFPDQPLDTTTINQAIISAEDTGETIIHIGQSTGTGDTRVGFGGSVFTQYNTQLPHGNFIDFSAAITECDVFGSSFLDITDGAAFSSVTTHHITNCTFNNCGQIDIGSIEARNLTFTGYATATAAALLWTTNTNIKNSQFLANRNSAGTASAIEHTTTTASTYYSLTFAGNDYDVNLTAASGTLVISNSGTANASTYKTGGTGTVSFISTKTVAVNIVDTSGAIQGAQVYIQKSTPTVYTSSTGNTAGDVDLVVAEAITADTPSTGWCLVTDISLNAILPYRYASWATSTFTFPTEVTFACTGGGTATSLQDTVNDFTAINIVEGDTIRNTTDGSWAVVDEIVDANNITTSALQGGTLNVWTSGDTYSVHKLATTLVSGTDLVDVPIMNEQTDINGDASIAFPYQSVEVPIDVSVRKSSSGSTRYSSFDGSGTININGYSATIRLSTDPNV